MSGLMMPSTTGLDDLVYNLRHGIKTDVHSSQTVKNIFKAIDKELDLDKLDHTWPTLLLKGINQRHINGEQSSMSRNFI